MKRASRYFSPPAPLRMSLVDRLVSAVSPVRGLHRMQAKQALNILTHGVTRDAGGRKGTLYNWAVKRLGRHNEQLARETIADRAQDLVANDPHAASTADSMAVNIVGTGLKPQSTPHAKILGWSEEDARAFQTQAEWTWSLWERPEEADARGRLPFWAIQYLSAYSLLVNGEFVRVPLMVENDNRAFSLCLQCVDPRRLMTPRDKLTDARIRDGITLGSNGRPTAYWLANPKESIVTQALTSHQFLRIPAFSGHRPGIFHGFIQKEDEQVRGVSVLAPAMKFFKDLSDYLDYELIGAIVAASFPVFIESANPYEQVGRLNPAPAGAAPPNTRLQEIAPGQIVYGELNQKPHVLDTNRPGNTFPDFVERILRAVGASVGMPYEIIAKDFSKTNYSSARAALLEAWRVFGFYQRWLVDSFCQPVWEMVMEEAWLRGMLKLPKSTPDFYAMRKAITRAVWIPPKRGHVDPKKEMDALVLGKDHNILTLAGIAAEMGGDWETNLDQRIRERKRETDGAIDPPARTATPGKDDSDNETTGN